MGIEITLQLEALKVIQQWSMWIITLSTAFIGAMGFAFKDMSDKKHIRSANYCIFFLLTTLVLAVILVGAIPSTIQKLAPEIKDNIVAFGANARGIYGYYYLDFIPLWLLISSQRITFMLGIFFGSRLIWLRYGQQAQS